MDNHTAARPVQEKEKKKKESQRFGSIRTLADVRRSNGFFAKVLQFLRRTWLDWVVLAALGIVTGGLWTVHSTRARYFPITFPSTTAGEIVYPDLAYPYVPPIFSATAAGVMSAAIPIASILLCQLHARIRSFDDATFAILGLAYSLVTGTFFQVVLKKSIGGYRPHFLSVCEPVIPAGVTGSGYGGLMYGSAVCTGNAGKIRGAMESFPSGHSEIAFAGYLYLAIYLNAHLRVFSLAATSTMRRPRYWKMLAVVAPVLLATYLASTLVLGHHHHWYDVIFGGLIGSLMAVWGYKMVFLSIWDVRTNAVLYRRGMEVEADMDGVGVNTHEQVLPTTRPEVARVV